ncbi:hypothetical protein ACFQ36_01175 [Arthrobacter sp. GCM10027362]|uniref:hypothetical protein n=1 Tax=Arthrobacter sp. GCM10027362 TaxID=3273379 RepID=UPI003638ABA9
MFWNRIRIFRTAPQLGPRVEQNSTVASSPETEPSKNEGTPEKPPVGVWVAISAALAVVVAIFTALGLEEDLLRRMVRNDPRGTAWAIGFVIVGASVPVILLLIPKTRRWATALTAVVTILSALLVVTGMIKVLWTGAESLHSRDMPGLSLSAVKSSSGAVTITSEATAAALRSSERILLRIYAVGSSASTDLDVERLCRDVDWPASNVPSSGSRVLHWGEAGPDRTGTAKVSESLVINGDDFSFVCAYTALLWKPPKEEPYFASSVVDLRSLTFAPTETERIPTSTPTSTLR